MHIMRNLNTMILFSFTKGTNPEYEAQIIKNFYKNLDKVKRKERINKIKKIIRRK